MTRSLRCIGERAIEKGLFEEVVFKLKSEGTGPVVSGGKHRGKGNSICKSKPYHAELEDKLPGRVRQEHKALNLHLGGQGQVPGAEVQDGGRDHSSLELQVHVGVAFGQLGAERGD